MKLQMEIDEKYVKDLHLNGLDGRMIHMPSKKKKTIILIHGHHTCVERHYSLAQYLNDFGEVFVPDLPGFGGMTSFYKIGKAPTFDNYADYIYALVKSKKIEGPITFVGMSFGSQVLTRLLQKYPDIKKQTKDVIGFVGFGAGSDMQLPRYFWFTYIPFAYIGSNRVGNKLIEWLVLNPLSLRVLVWLISRNRSNMKDQDGDNRDAIELEKFLWKANDNRTHCSTTINLLRDDLRKYTKKKINKKMTNLISKDDQFFNNERVKQTMLDLYKDYESIYLNLSVHAPSIVATKEGVYDIVPDELNRILSK